MAKLIFTSRYIRDAPPEHLQNYVRYISTREGVEKVDESKKNLPFTPAQKNLIRQLLKDMPESKDMLEYEDYRQHSTIGNASEFITQALGRNMDMAAVKENYVDYLANRTRVERLGEHGLFTDAGKPVILADVQKEVSGHKGPVWTHVVSLRREDAARLGYDSARGWMTLLRSKRAMLCKYMKIDSEDLRWYAAFHNEGHHPHVHLMVYSAKDNDGFLTKAGIEAMRSELAHDIFRQDFAQIYEGQNLARSSLKEKAADLFLKGSAAADLSSQKQLKSIKNMVIAEALKLGGHHFLSETSGQEKIQTEVCLDELEERIPDGSEETEIELETETEPVPADAGSMLEAEAFLSESGLDVPDPSEGEEKNSAKAEWSRQYKLARSYLYGSKKNPPGFSESHASVPSGSRAGKCACHV